MAARSESIDCNFHSGQACLLLRTSPGRAPRRSGLRSVAVTTGVQVQRRSGQPHTDDNTEKDRRVMTSEGPIKTRNSTPL